MDPLQVVFQFLKEEGYETAFNSLVEESGKEYNPRLLREHFLRQNLGEFMINKQTAAFRGILEGKKLRMSSNSNNLSLDASPVCMIKYGQGFIASFNDQSIKYFSRNLDIINSVKFSCPTSLSFQIHNDLLFFGGMGGIIGKISLVDFTLQATLQLKVQSVISIRILGDFLIAVSQSGTLARIRLSDFEFESTYDHQMPITSLCLVSNGVIYSCQNDNVFHYRSNENFNDLKYLYMNPNELDFGGVGIRDLRECPCDSCVFAALTDKHRAVIYRFSPERKELEILANITHFLSDGLTQPQIIWPHGRYVFVTSDEMKIVGVDISSNSVLCKKDGWKKSPRCMIWLENRLIIGAFDKSLSYIDFEDEND